jgi:2-keto-3-deoxy-L-rhamnonate aldolase RhmA
LTELAGFRARLHQPGKILAAMMSIPDPAVASILGWSGFDVVFLDAEHGAYTLTSLQACIEAVDATAASVAVRTGPVNPGQIQQVLDLGADGVLVAHVESSAEAETVVRATRYPPEGARGLGVGRANRYGLDLVATVEEANTKIAAMAIVESARGVENAAEIATVAGLDAIVVGAGDLAVDMNVFGQTDDTRLREAIEHVAGCARAARLRIGGASGDADLAICFADTAGIADAARAAVETAHAI